MKIGIIADIHSNVYGLKSVLKELKDADLIFCAGDIIGYYTFVNEVFGEIKKRGIKTILGNHDAYLLGKTFSTDPNLEKPLIYTKKIISRENFKYLQEINSFSLELEIDGIKIKMYHGSPWDKIEGYVYPDYPSFEKFKEIDANLIILGHTHWPMIKNMDGKIILNPGSCGQPRDYNTQASFATFDTRTKEVLIKRVNYDIERVYQAVKKQGFDEKIAQMLKRK